MKRKSSLAGIPYDLHRPTMARLKFTYWSAENPRFFPPKVTGLGWGINFFWLVHPLRWLKARHAVPLAPNTSSVAADSATEELVS
jgi:hypothetical protein